MLEFETINKSMEEINDLSFENINSSLFINNKSAEFQLSAQIETKIQKENSLNDTNDDTRINNSEQQTMGCFQLMYNIPYINEDNLKSMRSEDVSILHEDMSNGIEETKYVNQANFKLNKKYYKQFEKLDEFHKEVIGTKVNLNNINNIQSNINRIENLLQADHDFNNIKGYESKEFDIETYYSETFDKNQEIIDKLHIYAPNLRHLDVDIQTNNNKNINLLKNNLYNANMQIKNLRDKLKILSMDSKYLNSQLVSSLKIVKNKTNELEHVKKMLSMLQLRLKNIKDEKVKDLQEKNILTLGKNDEKILLNNKINCLQEENLNLLNINMMLEKEINSLRQNLAHIPMNKRNIKTNLNASIGDNLSTNKKLTDVSTLSNNKSIQRYLRKISYEKKCYENQLKMLEAQCLSMCDSNVNNFRNVEYKNNINESITTDLTNSKQLNKTTELDHKTNVKLDVKKTKSGKFSKPNDNDTFHFINIQNKPLSYSNSDKDTDSIISSENKETKTGSASDKFNQVRTSSILTEKEILIHTNTSLTLNESSESFLESQNELKASSLIPFNVSVNSNYIEDNTMNIENSTIYYLENKINLLEMKCKKQAELLFQHNIDYDLNYLTKHLIDINNIKPESIVKPFYSEANLSNTKNESMVQTVSLEADLFNSTNENKSMVQTVSLKTDLFNSTNENKSMVQTVSLEADLFNSTNENKSMVQTVSLKTDLSNTKNENKSMVQTVSLEADLFNSNK